MVDHQNQSERLALKNQASRRWLYRAFLFASLGGLVLVIRSWLNRPVHDVPHGEPAIENVDRPTTSLTDLPVSPVNIATSAEADGELADARVRKDDPAHDNWDTEVLADAAMKQLAALAKRIEGGGGVNADKIREFVDDSIVCSRLRPQELQTIIDEHDWSVRRMSRDDVTTTDSFPFHGMNGFASAVAELLDDGETDVHVKFKLYQIDSSSHSFATKVLYERSYHKGESVWQENATWRCEWTSLPQKGQKPRLKRVELKQYEQVRIAAPQGRLFIDVTRSVMGRNDAYRNQVLPSIDHSLRRIVPTGLVYDGLHGLAIGDVNGDGLEDLYVCDTRNLPNRLYVQRPDGTVEDISSEAGVDWLEYSTAALFVDLDNDGDQDLIVTSQPHLLFAENDGWGRFTIRSGMPDVVDGTSLSAVDFDHDGDLDIYLCGYSPEPNSEDLPMPLPYHNAVNGLPNALFRNDGDFRFTNVTDEVGLNENNTRFSFAASWEDYDDDGDMDLYVANDFGPNNLYRNDEGRFTDVASEAGVEDVATGMGVTWGDFDRDGKVDLYVSNMFSSAGNRIAFQRRFGKDKSAAVVTDLQRMARGNTLFKNIGAKGFQDVSQQAAVTMGRWAWASKFADLNNDGWQDLIVANGFLTREDTSDL